jgi:hypothetical protein
VTSRFARSAPTPSKYDWCKKVITAHIPKVGDPWPPWFLATVDYYYDSPTGHDVRVTGSAHLQRVGTSYMWRATINQGDPNDPSTVTISLNINPGPETCSIGLVAQRGEWLAPQRSSLNVPMPDPWTFEWSAPPWQFAPGTTVRDKVTFTH